MAAFWTGAEDAKLRELQEKGASATQIGLALKRSKNSVIGRASRLGILLAGSSIEARRQKRAAKGLPPPKPRPSRAKSEEEKEARRAEMAKVREERRLREEQKRAEKLRKLAEKPKPAESFRPARRTVYVPTRSELQCVAVQMDEVGTLTLFDLKEHTCRWPFGGGSETTYCGKRRTEGSPYCTAHKIVSRFGVSELKSMFEKEGIAA